jgi:hypothetical protein
VVHVDSKIRLFTVIKDQRGAFQHRPLSSRPADASRELEVRVLQALVVVNSIAQCIQDFGETIIRYAVQKSKAGDTPKQTLQVVLSRRCSLEIELN